MWGNSTSWQPVDKCKIPAKMTSMRFGETAVKTKHSSVIFLPVILSLLAFNVYCPVQFSPPSDLTNKDSPEISRDCFPVSTSSVLVASKSKTEFSPWHGRLFLRVIHQSHRYWTPFISTKLPPSPTISQIASKTAMRCWNIPQRQHFPSLSSLADSNRIK